MLVYCNTKESLDRSVSEHFPDAYTIRNCWDGEGYYFLVSKDGIKRCYVSVYHLGELIGKIFDLESKVDKLESKVQRLDDD